jgi:hypothetical protein
VLVACDPRKSKIKMIHRKDARVISTEAPASSVEDRNGGEVEKSGFEALFNADFSTRPPSADSLEMTLF